MKIYFDTFSRNTFKYFDRNVNQFWHCSCKDLTRHIIKGQHWTNIKIYVPWYICLEIQFNFEKKNITEFWHCACKELTWRIIQGQQWTLNTNSNGDENDRDGGGHDSAHNRVTTSVEFPRLYAKKCIFHSFGVLLSILGCKIWYLKLLPV